MISLFQENEKLKHENDDLRERAVVSYVFLGNLIKTKSFSFFASGFQEGRRLVGDSDNPSYAAELEVLSKDEVRKNQIIFSYSKIPNSPFV